MCAVVTSWLMKLIIIVQIVVIDGNIQTSTTKLVIKSPESLSNNEQELEHRNALFGNPPYGTKVEGPLLYYGSICSPYYYPFNDPPDLLPPRFDKKNFIVLVDRGDCDLYNGVYQLRYAGIAGVLIIDDYCPCSDNDCLDSYHSCQTQPPPISYDTTMTTSISLVGPVMFISKKDGDRMKEYLQQFETEYQYRGAELMVEMSYILPSNKVDSDKVTVDLWNHPANKYAYNFVSGIAGDFGLVVAAFGDKLQFTPHEYIYSGLKMNCLGNNGNILCHNQCTNHGRYCSTPVPETAGTNDVNEISGAQKVAESLRRMCIWETYGKNNVGYEWWLYVRDFETNCAKFNDLFSNVGCIQDCYDNSGIDGTLISLCMYNSGGLMGNNVNTLLEQALVTQEEFGVAVVPSVFVNQVQIHGGLSFSNLFNATCAGFEENQAPSFCSSCNFNRKQVDCVLQEHDNRTLVLDNYIPRKSKIVKDIEVDMNGLSVMDEADGVVLEKNNNNDGTVVLVAKMASEKDNRQQNSITQEKIDLTLDGTITTVTTTTTTTTTNVVTTTTTYSKDSEPTSGKNSLLTSNGLIVTILVISSFLGFI